MKVELIDWTQNALELLLYTKNTRLQGGQTFEEIIMDWSEEKKLEHLAYMRDTIKSSWEFVNYTFQISEVTRAFTHQLVRTRNGRYAQESMRTVDVRDADFLTPSGPDPELQNRFDGYVIAAMYGYENLIDLGMPVQDARGLLPTNVCTSIIAQFSLRTLHEMAVVRLCTRTQGEYQDVFRAMKAQVVRIHPWADDFIQVGCVNTGVCVFPRYKDCPIQKFTHTAELMHEEVRANVKRRFNEIRHEARPVVKDGRTM